MTTDHTQTMRVAADHLSARDPILALVIKRFGLCTIQPHDDHYRELVDAIISQQLSIKAAATIFKRFVELFDGAFPTPQDILAKDAEQLRTVGLSRAKAAYVCDLAHHIVDGQLELDRFPSLPNDQVVRELTAVKGIGEWTAHMFLIFSLGRADVLATGDLGLRMAMMRLYRLDAPPKPDEMRAIADKYSWHPYQSIACWYLWQSLDNAPKL